MGMDPETARHPPRRKRRSRRRRALRVGLWGVVALAIGISTAVYFAIDRTLRAPDWMRDRVETRLEQNLGGFQIRFGDVEFVLNKGWRPRLRLRNLELAQPDGSVLAQLADAEASLAMRPLLRGRVQPKVIALTGAYAGVTRDRDGTISFSFGETGQLGNRAENLQQLIALVDSVFDHPQITALTRLELNGLTLRYEDARQGRAWTLDGGTLLLSRDGDDLRVTSGFSVLSGRDYASAIELNFASRIGETAAEFGAAIDEVASEDIAAQSVGLAWMDVLRAPISGALRGSVDAQGGFGPLSATLQIGAGAIQPTDQTRPIPFQGARSYFTYDPVAQVLEFDELSGASDWGSGFAEGRAYLGLNQAGLLNDLVAQMRFSNLSLDPRGLFPEPLQITSARADLKVEFDPFRVTAGEVLITEGDSQVHASGRVETSGEDWAYRLDANLDRISPARLLSKWPETLSPKARVWASENLRDGVIDDVHFAMRGVGTAQPVLYLDFAFRDVTARFMKTMPPIMRSAGRATLIGGRFVVQAATGVVTPDQGGEIDISGSSFIIPEVTVKNGTPGIVRLQANGPVTSVLSLLNRPPLQVLKQTDLPVDMVDATASAEGTVALALKPKLQPEEVAFHFAGDITGAKSTVLVPGFTLTSETLAISGDQGQIRIRGGGQIDDLPATAEWSRRIGKGAPPDSRVSGQVELSERAIRTFRIGLPEGSVFGTGLGEYAVDLVPDEPPRLTLNSDLVGVGLRIPVLNWSKSPDSAGRLEVSGILGESARIDRLEIEGGGLSATGSVTTRPDGGLDKASFEAVRMSDWLQAPVDMIGKGANPPEIRVLGGTIDMRRAPFSANSGQPDASAARSSAPSSPVNLTLDQLRVTDSIALTDFSGRFGTTGGFNGSFTGRLNGGTAVNGQAVPQKGGTAFRIRSDDAGGVARDSGVLRHGHGGSFDMTLIPADKAGEFDGQLTVRDVNVKDAPAIAALINSISLVGLIDELAGQGVYFTSVRSKFVLGPSYLTVREASAEGPSIGLSMDGTYDLANGLLNMRGVISPIYLFNIIGSVVTRRGEGVFGFTYSLTGTADDPQVQVNPLSGLAPAMIRDIFRGPTPSAPGQDVPEVTPREIPGGAKSGGDR